MSMRMKTTYCRDSPTVKWKSMQMNIYHCHDAPTAKWKSMQMNSSSASSMQLISLEMQNSSTCRNV